MRLIIYAPNVHEGGGNVLLLALLRTLAGKGDVMAIIDSRLEVPFWMPASNIDLRVPPTILGRLRADRRLRVLADACTRILCFGNLPPLFKCSGRVILFLQNRYLTGNLDSSVFSLRARVRISVERTWLRSRVGVVDEVVVQSASMANEVEQAFGFRPRVLPFAPEMTVRERNEPFLESEKAYRYDFVYVASGEPHKNHRALLEAWSLLAQEGIRPTLCLTLDSSRFPQIVGWMNERISAEGVFIENVGQISADKVQELYLSSRALIYPSLGESLGLPLVEARGLGLPIITAEMDYVRDVVEPEQTFDPNSPVSIARAVKRFLGIGQPPVPMLTPQQFLEVILST